MQYQNVLDWVLRIVRLDFSAFEEARRDQTATIPILIVVAVASLLTGAGSFLWGVVNVEGIDEGDLFIQSFLLGSIFQFGLWFVWVFVTYMMLTQVFRAAADLNQMLRVLGLAFLPMAIALLMFVPVVDFAIGLVAVVAAVLLVQAALQDTTNATPPQAMVANLLGFAVLAVVLTILAGEGDTFAPGFFALDSAKDAYLDIADAVAGFFENV